jgi:hypothetical protein
VMRFENGLVAEHYEIIDAAAMRAAATK